MSSEASLHLVSPISTPIVTIAVVLEIFTWPQRKSEKKKECVTSYFFLETDFSYWNY